MEGTKKGTLLHKIVFLLFVAYVAMLCYFLFFAENLDRNYADRMYHYNLTLFKEIKRFWQHRDILDTRAVMLNLVGNVVAFIPFGIFLPVLFQRCRNFFLTVLLCMEFSLCVEIIQLVCKVGILDVDDIFLNTLGGLTGFILYRLVCIIRRKNDETEKK